ncbi:MAG: TIGR00266 family protein [Anaerolineales bacterium]|nr:TIGR00266 family protein [Anaerolineales bacterium]
MECNVLYRPSYSVAELRMAPEEAITAESGAMVSMTEGIEIETKMRGGVLKSIARSVLGGESFFINTFRAGASGGEVMLAPALPGDVQQVAVQDSPLLVQSGSFLAAEETVEVDTEWGGTKTFFASEGLFMLRCAGSGTLILASYGAMHERELAAGESFTVDTGHLVAFSQSLEFNVRRVGGLKSSMLSGEGLVVHLEGPGRVILQTRSEDALLSWLIPKLPKQRSSD